MGATGVVPSVFPRFDGYFALVHGRIEPACARFYADSGSSDLLQEGPPYRPRFKSFNYPGGSHSSSLLFSTARSLLNIFVGVD